MKNPIVAIGFITSTCCLLLGCASQDGTLTMEQEVMRERAMNNYVDCTNSGAERLDDGKSDALTIAKGIASMCHSEYQQSLAASSAGLNNRARHYFYKKMNSSQQVTNGPLNAVLLERAKHK